MVGATRQASHVSRFRRNFLSLIRSREQSPEARLKWKTRGIRGLTTNMLAA
jgi:hypothetical protein